jgi:hypothetical protein
MEKSAVSKIGQPLSDDDRLDIEAWMEKRQRQVGAQALSPAPVSRGNKAILSDDEKAAIIFNETRSLSGSDIHTAREYLAHALSNADETWGGDRAKYAGSAPSVIPHGVPEVEGARYQSAVDAVAAAKSQRANGVDPTQGALNFNFRTPTQSGSFQGRSVKTRIGPLDNSYPTKQLPGSGIYSNTCE